MKIRQAIAIVVLLLAIVTIVFGIRACTAPAPAPSRIKSGQSTILGDVKWTVISVLKTRSVGPDDGRVEADAWFLVVDLYLTNGGKDKLTLDPEGFKLSDNTKNSYSIDKKATDAQLKGLANPKLASIFNATITTNAKQRVVLVFAIPETSSALVLNVDGSSVGADRDLIIDLGF
jgi:hypothetical protein